MMDFRSAVGHSSLMFVRVKSTPDSPRKFVQIVASTRTDGKVRQKIIRHISIAMDDKELVRLKELAVCAVET